MTTPTPQDIQAAIELTCCPWCNEPATTAPKGGKQRCRTCHARWEITPYGGLLQVAAPGQSPGGIPPGGHHPPTPNPQDKTD